MSQGAFNVLPCEGGGCGGGGCAGGGCAGAVGLSRMYVKTSCCVTSVIPEITNKQYQFS